MNSRLHRLTAATSVAILALGVTACGGDDDKKAADPDKSSATPSSKEETEPPAPTGEHTALFKKISDAQAEAGTTHVAMTIGASAQQITAVGDLKLGNEEVATALSADVKLAGNPDYSLSMIWLERDLFLNLGQTTGNKYGEIDLDNEKDEPLAMQFTPLAERMDPNEQLAQLATAVISVKKKGEPQKIDGVDTQPHEAVVDPKKLFGADNVPKDTPKTVTYTLFVGPDQLLRRITTGVKDSKVQGDYTKWGEPVRIKAPKSSQISADALNQLRGPS